MEKNSCIGIHVNIEEDGPNLEIFVDEEEFNPNAFVEQAVSLIMFAASDNLIEEIHKQIKSFCKSIDNKKLYKQINAIIQEITTQKTNAKTPPAVEPIDIFRNRR